MLIDELTAEERDALVERLAQRVVERRLESVAVLFLEMHKPLAFLSGQALLVGVPILGVLFGYENMQRLALFLQKPENVEALLQRIETLSRERSAPKPGESGAAPEGSG